MTRDQDGKAFGEEVGRDPCFVAEIIARERGFVERDVDAGGSGVLGVDRDVEGTGDRRHGRAA